LRWYASIQLWIVLCLSIWYR